MKTKLLFLPLLTIAVIGAKAQNLIAVQHAGKPAFYTKLPDAITNALAGDTVYIPGGGFDAITINKELHLIGVGDNPDSTSATARTIVPSVTLTTGADNGSITGVLVNGPLIFGAVNGYTISRCNIYSLASDGSAGTGNIKNFTISENIMNEVNIPGTNHLITNNIFTFPVGFSNPINYSIIRNNIFTIVTPIGSYFSSLFASNCTIENNIFAQASNSAYALDGTGNIFNNNINVGLLNNDISRIGQGSGNISSAAGTPLRSIFTSYDPTTVPYVGGTTIVDGIYKNNFNIIPSSPYKNAGTDGTDVGVYGGAFPWKPGSVPFNPHFQNVKITPQTDASGNLRVQITVAAQNN